MITDAVTVLAISGVIYFEHESRACSSLIAGILTAWRFNLGGFVAHTLREDLSRQCYTQLFREGGIEVVSGAVISKNDDGRGFFAWAITNGLDGYLLDVKLEVI